jgi:hypothetical protein
MHIKHVTDDGNRNSFACIYVDLLHLNYSFVIKCSHRIFQLCSDRNMRRIIHRKPENGNVWNSYNTRYIPQSDPEELEAQVRYSFYVDCCNIFYTLQECNCKAYFPMLILCNFAYITFIYVDLFLIQILYTYSQIYVLASITGIPAYFSLWSPSILNFICVVLMVHWAIALYRSWKEVASLHWGNIQVFVRKYSVIISEEARIHDYKSCNDLPMQRKPGDNIPR